MAKKLFVGGISWNTSDQSLQDFFSQIGKVISAVIIKDRYTGKSKGFGFVEMEVDAEADRAMTELNGKELDGRAISVSEAKPMQPRDNNFSRGGGGGGYNRDNRGGGGNDRRDDRRFR